MTFGFAAMGEEACAFPDPLVIIKPINMPNPPYDAPIDGAANGTVEADRTVTTTLYKYVGGMTFWELVNSDSDDTTSTGGWATSHNSVAAGYYKMEVQDGVDSPQVVYFWVVD